ncbi:MAG: tyrosine-type recombinase/integrase [Methanomicrobia archaeon]|nr:tyrosine-type recombinase/integrase [Methanomicrobia archaeon]
MLYDFENAFSNVRERIATLENKENAQLIENFLKQLFAEGVSQPRVIKYANHLKVIAERINKNFLEVTKEDITIFLAELEQHKYTSKVKDDKSLKSYSEWTKKDYKVALKKFFRFLDKEELVKDIKTTMKNSRKKLPEEILTKSEIKRMIETADHPRDKAIIAVLYEGGLRIGELASLKMKNVEFDDYGAVIKVKGKTGERRVRIISSASLLAKWIETHPERNNKNASLWINLATNYKNRGISYRGISEKLKTIAKGADVDKTITPHLFRHSRATHLATVLTEAEMNEYFGWVQGSDMPATYVHLSGRDVDDKMLKIYGLKREEKEKEEELKPKECPRCKYINSPTDRFCSRCSAILDEEEAVKIRLQGQKLAKEFPDIAFEDPKRLMDMKKFMEMVEIFEKNPELFEKMRMLVDSEKGE